MTASGGGGVPAEFGIFDTFSKQRFLRKRSLNGWGDGDKKTTRAKPEHWHETNSGEAYIPFAIGICNKDKKTFFFVVMRMDSMHLIYGV